ncbi:UdgX family uracil-DNA binding protein [Paraburkholderia phymatum]|uniref:Type-4 uracil-DNA glycosylase n=1 Tax=Paraburkholderia phymatum (strain DSM 17167 / CIP 108236 / LMG 21445 / STM815) TaxID=391038 RepID=B2JI98_PARP8|nr:UdgX family uracil-DNA binding protein [Paraburkholderia phymatum]ACC70492.1 phage SPO1 DNA polymerase-related protein [Paraburkholderia phymatum STM815]
MHVTTIEDTFAAWREAARQALAQRVAPEEIDWRIRDGARAAPSTLFDDKSATPFESAVCVEVLISRELAELLNDAALYRAPGRWAFLYRVLWRWHGGDRSVASPADSDGARLHKMAKAVRRAKHDMIAYLRFRLRDASHDTPTPDLPEYVAWYEPEHDVLAWSAEHFARRMGRSTWLISTPDGAAWWDGSALRVERRRAPSADLACTTADEAERLWLAYYRNTFNPARLNETALEQHMPVRFWKGLPEGRLIPSLISEAKSGAQRVAQASSVGMLGGKSVSVDAHSAQPMRQHLSTLDACRHCELWQHATQAVDGIGPDDARIMLIGEQPGDHEDLAGKPFVGPAGRLLDVALQRAGLSRDGLYLTNAVKHFKWTLRGKRRLHKTAAQQEIDACGYWLERELQRVRPAVVVTLGATALSALLHEKVNLSDWTGRTLNVDDMRVVATYHPSYALRQQHDEARERVLAAIIGALTRARDLSEAVGERQHAPD